MSVLSPTAISVDALPNHLVRLRIGEFQVDMEYETALKVSQFLRVRGKQAKRLAGDQSRHWSTIGVLDGLPSDQREAERQLPGAVVLGVGIR